MYKKITNSLSGNKTRFLPKILLRMKLTIALIGLFIILIAYLIGRVQSKPKSGDIPTDLIQLYQQCIWRVQLWIRKRQVVQKVREY